MPSRRPTIFAAAALAAVTMLSVLSPAAARSGSPCPPGFSPQGSDTAGRTAPTPAMARAVADRAGRAGNDVVCVRDNRPESFREMSAMIGQRDAILGADAPAGLYRKSLEQRAALAAAASSIAGAAGRWAPYGKGPLVANDERFPSVNGEGLAELNGRIDSLDYDAKGKRLFALVGTGGVWMSTDMAKSWRSIGDNLPTQTNGALAWSPADGGTLIVVSGESLQAGSARTGLGAFRTRNLGRTWEQARGIPDGALGFAVAVDPTNPKVAYAATSKGLFRSSDTGKSWTNVRLPTGECAGKTDNQRCLLANMVTDVDVQSPDKFGHKGGRVLAAVGYRAGTRPYPQLEQDTPESPANGIYRSDTGLPGTFQRLQATGFPGADRMGRTEFGVATGPDQNHDYVYAIVQDAILFRGGFPTIDAPEDTWPGPSNTTLNGIYVSADFGTTWTQMGDTVTISENPATGSGLVGAGQALFFAPGVQAWYNEWIAPDPTRQDANGVPTRLTFGLEEVWQNELTNQPQNGRSSFKVIGRYFAGENCMIVLSGVPYCPTHRPPGNMTTTHPDQHDALYIPDGNGGVTLVVGNDGGAYVQHVGANEEFDNSKWGVGANRGFNTLLPYHARVAKDGTVWFGLQDNGSGKIEPGTRKQLMTFGGDGFFVAVDPNNSSYAWSETPNAGMRVTTDGGQTWKGQPPPVTSSQFSNPFVMDPKDSNHLLTAGNEVVETLDGPDTCTVVGAGTVAETAVRCTWKEVFDLGTRSKPGDPDAGEEVIPPGGDPPNSMSAVDLLGDAAYVGFCGPCSVMNTDVPFQNGLATNVGGSAPPKKGTSDGWHIAAAKGLPNRTITSIAIDPKNPRTVYVTLGGYDREWRPPGSYGDANKRHRGGNVFRSTDAGQTFVDVSRGLPNTPALWVTLRGSQILVGTNIGAFISSDARGTRWARLGTGLPNVPVTSLQVHPGNANVVIASTFGRGIYAYTFPPAARKPSVLGVKRGTELPATGVETETTGVVVLALAGAFAVRLRRRRPA